MLELPIQPRTFEYVIFLLRHWLIVSLSPPAHHATSSCKCVAVRNGCTARYVYKRDVEQVHASDSRLTLVRRGCLAATPS